MVQGDPACLTLSNVIEQRTTYHRKVWTVSGKPTQLLQHIRRRWGPQVSFSSLSIWSWGQVGCPDPKILRHILIIFDPDPYNHISILFQIISFRLACLEQNRMDFAAIPISPLYTCKVSISYRWPKLSLLNVFAFHFHFLFISKTKKKKQYHEKWNHTNDLVFEGLCFSPQTVAGKQGLRVFSGDFDKTQLFGSSGANFDWSGHGCDDHDHNQ